MRKNYENVPLALKTKKKLSDYFFCISNPCIIIIIIDAIM